MNKDDLIVWVEPDDNFNPILRAITIKDAIEERRKITPFSISDEDAMWDFIAVHWGQIYTLKKDD